MYGKQINETVEMSLFALGPEGDVFLLFEELTRKTNNKKMGVGKNI